MQNSEKQLSNADVGLYVCNLVSYHQNQFCAHMIKRLKRLSGSVGSILKH